MAFPTFPTVGSTIKALWSGSTARARLNMTRSRALHGPAITSITFRVEEDHDGQAALRDRTGQSPADGHGRVVGSLALTGGRKNSQLHPTTPNELCAELHNRTPVVLKPETWPVWLAEHPADVPQLKALLAPCPSDEMICWPVIIRVGNVKNNATRASSSRSPAS